MTARCLAHFLRGNRHPDNSQVHKFGSFGVFAEPSACPNAHRSTYPELVPFVPCCVTWTLVLRCLGKVVAGGGFNARPNEVTNSVFYVATARFSCLLLRSRSCGVPLNGSRLRGTRLLGGPGVLRPGAPGDLRQGHRARSLHQHGAPLTGRRNTKTGRPPGHLSCGLRRRLRDSKTQVGIKG